jgi:hypothetical protein
MFADNCHVLIHLHDSDQDSTTVSGQVKAHVLQNGGLVIAKDGNQTYVYLHSSNSENRRQFHVDAVYDKKMTSADMCLAGGLPSFANYALEGFNTAILMMGVTRGSHYQR